ncbi:hypothetical protein ANN_15479 [Periplaneta americana]|uniref:Reverse transcriptase domain-containing protein n=1 Tax=Periplaneta americana TaxID=6978 RepID=A0ABQ8SHP8_PERAM|nr:hypothetical protein ANN_15479 [Periplaneta americana]
MAGLCEGGNEPPGSLKARENPKTIRENTGILLEAYKEIGLEVNPEKTKYMIMSRDENIVRNGNIKIVNVSFEEVEKSKYLGATVSKGAKVITEDQGLFPRFAEPIPNVTVSVGRDALLACVVDNLRGYKKTFSVGVRYGSIFGLKWSVRHQGDTQCFVFEKQKLWLAHRASVKVSATNDHSETWERNGNDDDNDDDVGDGDDDDMMMMMMMMMMTTKERKRFNAESCSEILFQLVEGRPRKEPQPGYPLECVAIPLATWHSVGQWKLAASPETSIPVQFVPKVLNGIEIRTLCRPVQPVNIIVCVPLLSSHRNMGPTAIVQLSAKLQEEWRRIPVDILHKLVENIPDRVAAVSL